RAGNISRGIDGINRPAEPGELVLYTPEFHRTTLTLPGRIEIAVRNNRVTSVKTSGSQQIPENGFVLSASGEAGDWIRKHLPRGRTMTVETKAAAQPPTRFRAAFFIGGGPQLISNGAAVAETEFGAFSASLIGSRHPRTAVGMRKDGHLLFVTVDGRQPSMSVGMTIRELSALMLELQCAEAINLDGGGSTTMVIRDKVVNRPSDPTGERPVSDALLLLQRR
ncbi:MAG: phosphodiester glycosidase family protein, partial [Acidobacteriota bacterium]